MRKQHVVTAGIAATASLGLATLAWSQQPRGPSDSGAVTAASEAPDAAQGTVGRIAKYNTATTLTNSVIREAAGRIGIGIAPTTGLHLKTATRGYGVAHTDGTVTLSTFVGLGDVDPAGGWLGTRSDHPLHFFANNSQARMTISPAGKVGIGGAPSISTMLRVAAPTAGASQDAIYARAFNTGYAVYAYNESGSPFGRAGSFVGNVSIIGGTFTKPGGSFKIDHPTDPANKYLSHSFVESPDMLNVYNGGVVLDAEGRATVTLPAYFSSLNRDFQYQLTAIGAPGPNLYVAEEIADNRFVIAGGKGGAKVSWQVTGIRQDAWANAHRIPIEEMKPAHERGLYLAPRVHGQPDDKGIDWARMQGARGGGHADADSTPTVADRRLAAARD